MDTFVFGAGIFSWSCEGTDIHNCWKAKKNKAEDKSFLGMTNDVSRIMTVIP